MKHTVQTNHLWQALLFTLLQFVFKDITYIMAPIDLKEEGKGIVEEKVPVVNFLSLMQYLVTEHGVHLTHEELRQYWSHIEDRFPWGSSHPCSATKITLATQHLWGRGQVHGLCWFSGESHLR